MVSICTLRVRLFLKSFSPKPACLVATENKIFRKSSSCWPKFTSLTRKWIYTLIFTSIYFRREREREREREPRSEREREKREPRSESTDRRAARSKSGAIVQRARSSIVATRCDRSLSTAVWSSPFVDWRVVRSSLLVDQWDHDRRRRRLTSSAIAPSFFWVCLVCLFLLLLQTPENFFQNFFWNVTKHMKIFSFPKNSISEKWNIFWKCFYTNQT